MNIHQITSSSYSVIEQGNGKFWLVKIIGEYSSENEAYFDMVRVFNHKITEQALEKNFLSKRYTDINID